MFSRMCKHLKKNRNDIVYYSEKKPYTKRIFLFTNDDNPNATDRSQREQAINYAKVNKLYLE